MNDTSIDMCTVTSERYRLWPSNIARIFTQHVENEDHRPRCRGLFANSLGDEVMDERHCWVFDSKST